MVEVENRGFPEEKGATFGDATHVVSDFSEKPHQAHGIVVVGRGWCLGYSPNPQMGSMVAI